MDAQMLDRTSRFARCAGADVVRATVQGPGLHVARGADEPLVCRPVVALLLRFRSNEHARRFAARLLRQMPVIVAVGVNLGIVPLLFLQLAYYRFFYPATILMAWFWLAIIGLLIPAYYGVYVYAFGLSRESNVAATAAPSPDGEPPPAGCPPLFFSVHRLFVCQRAEPDGSRGSMARTMACSTTRPGRRWERGSMSATRRFGPAGC